jgi:hypothetical protein
VPGEKEQSPVSATDVPGLVAELRAGRLTIGDLAERFRNRDWPAAGRRWPGTYAEMAAHQDVGTDVPGSLDEVTAAYDRGDLSSDEYRALCDAVADAIDASPRSTASSIRSCSRGDRLPRGR